MSERRPFGGALQRQTQGLSVDSAAAKARLTPDQRQALEAEDAIAFTLTPGAYAAVARALGKVWTLVYS